MTLADPTHSPAAAAGTPRAALRQRRGISAATQARLDAGLMRGRLPWPVALYLLCVALPVWFHAGPLYLSLLRLYLLVMIVPVVMRLLMGHFGRPIPTDWLFLAHTAWMAVALAVTSPAQMVTQVGSVGLEFLGGYAIARAYIRTPEDFLALCRWLVAMVLCLAPLAVYEARTGMPLVLELIRSLPGIESLAKVRPDPRLGLFRAQTIFAHAIHHGLFCSVVFSLCFVALRGVVSDGRRWISAAIVAATGFLGLSSGAWLAILLQIALIAWAWTFRSTRQRWWLLVGLFALAYVVIDLLSNRTPIRLFMSYATFSAHNAYWRGIIFEWGLANIIGSAEKGIPASPWVGIGMNSWIRPSFMHSGSMDNFWLVIALRYGLPGLFLLAAGYALGIARVMRRDFTADPVLAQIRLAWVFTFVGLTFTLCTVHVWSTVYSFIFFMFGAGMWLIFARPADPAATAPEAADPARAFASATRGPASGGAARYSRFAPKPRQARP